jgi:hypothetical protein
MARTLNITLYLALAASAFVGCGSDDDGGGTAGTAGSGGSGGSSGTGGGDSGQIGLTCDEACPGVSGAGCSKGPPSTALCGAICTGILGGTDQTCADAMRSMLGCLTPASTYVCDADGTVTSPGCEAEFAAAKPCLPQV